MTKNLKALRDDWFLSEEANAYRCCQQCGNKFTNSEANIKRGFHACDNAYKEIMDKMEKALVDITQAHREIQKAQERHYSQPYYQDMKRDGLKYDCSIAATFMINDVASEALDELKKWKGEV